MWCVARFVTLSCPTIFCCFRSRKILPLPVAEAIASPMRMYVGMRPEVNSNSGGGSMYWVEVKHIYLGDLFTCVDDFTSVRACASLINKMLFLFQISKNFSKCTTSQMCTHGLGVNGMRHYVISDSFCQGCHLYRYTQKVICAYTIVWAALAMRYCYLLFVLRYLRRDNECPLPIPGDCIIYTCYCCRWRS